ncbi:hypothetical protein JQ628_11975 [Bradyrhizobium lablabi]|nr:hypothetical protein [Bradyrhizobium lablabi]
MRGVDVKAATTDAEVDAQQLFLEPCFPLVGQPFELGILLTDAIGDPRLALFARRAGRLFNQLPDVVPKDCDPIIELGQR